MDRHNYFGLADELEAWARMAWRAPPFGSERFQRWLQDRSMAEEEFAETPQYIAAVANGLIVDGEWTGIDLGGTGWVSGVAFRRQVDWRVRYVALELQDAVEVAQDDVARPLLDEELGAVLVAHMEAYAAEVFDPEELQLYAPRRVPNAYPSEDQELLWATAMRFASDVFVDQLFRAKLPRFYVRPGMPGQYLPQYNAIAIPSEVEQAGEFQRAVAAFLLTVGVVQRAATYLRNRLAYVDPLVRLIGGGYALPGPWLDASDGQVAAKLVPELEQLVVDGVRVSDELALKRFGALHGSGEFLLNAAARLVPGREADVAKAWTRVPEQLALYCGTMRGHFVELPEAP